MVLKFSPNNQEEVNTAYKTICNILTRFPGYEKKLKVYNKEKRDKVKKEIKSSISMSAVKQAIELHPDRIFSSTDVFRAVKMIDSLLSRGAIQNSLSILVRNDEIKLKVEGKGVRGAIYAKFDLPEEIEEKKKKSKAKKEAEEAAEKAKEVFTKIEIPVIPEPVINMEPIPDF